MSLKFSSEIFSCPKCGTDLKIAEDFIYCENTTCAAKYPLANGLPVLIDDAKSLFKTKDFLAGKETFFNQEKKGKAASFFEKNLPKLSLNISARENFLMFKGELFRRSNRPRVLVVGGGILGQGFEVIASDPKIELIETDVSLGERTQVIADIHNLPFKNDAFDGVIAQAVLEHVADPIKAAGELTRVLKTNGLLYAETPFLYPVHAGPYDFNRWTYLGLRRLFRNFGEIKSGLSGGPGTALAVTYQSFLLSFSENPKVRKFLYGLARLTLWPYKYFDKFLNRKKSAYDGAAGYYFLGVKNTKVYPNSELLKLYHDFDRS